MDSRPLVTEHTGNRPVTVIPFATSTGAGKTYMVTLAKADTMIARGQAQWLFDGTRCIKETRLAVRGELRSWRKVTNRSKNGAALYSSMQLVPGVTQGRNTGSRHGHTY